jgi:hypothetical protein
MIAESIAKVLVGHRAGATWMARCPAHEDRKPNLSISSGRDGKVLVRCHAGCGQRDVIAILRQRGFWEPGSHGAASPTSVKIAFPMHANALTRSEAGHKARGPLRAIRDKCLNFSCSQVSEVRLCEATLWYDCSGFTECPRFRSTITLDHCVPGAGAGTLPRIPTSICS